MGQSPASFQTIKTKPPFYKKPSTLAVLAIFIFLGACSWFLMKGPEDTLVARVKSGDAVAPLCAYALGFRGIRQDSTRDAFEQLVATGPTDKPSPEGVRVACCWALGHLKQQHVVLYLIDALKKDPSVPVRCAAARALGKTGEPQACEPIMAAIVDGEADVRQAAAEGAQSLGDKRAIEPLIERCDDVVPGVRRAVHDALVALTGTSFDGIDEKAQWKRWREGH